MSAIERVGDASYAGTYRLVYVGAARFLEVRGLNGFSRIARPVPAHIRSVYSAATHFGV